MDATEIQNHSQRRRRLDPSPAATPDRSFYGWDVLSGAVGLSLLVEHFRARAAYGTCLLLALILPGVLCLVSRPYRQRMDSWLRGQWARLETYSTEAGSRRIPWLAVAVFAVAPSWLLYLSNGQTLGAIDTRPVVPTAISLISEGNLELGEYFRPGLRKVSLRASDGEIPLCFQGRPTGIYSSYPAGMVPFAVAVTGLSALCDANLDNLEVQAHLQKMTAAMVAAVAVGLFFLVALRLAPPWPAWVATAILAVGSGMFSTVGMGLWQHGGIILWSLLILLIEFRRSSHPSRWDSLIQGFACAQMVTCRLSSITFLAPFGLWVFLRSPRRAVAVVASSGLFYLPWAWVYVRTYGNPFGPSTGFLSGGLWTLDLARPMAGVLFSPGRGLLIYQPWILLAFAVAIPAVRGRIAGMERSPVRSGWSGFCVAFIMAQVVLISAWGIWWGGWCWGSRLVVDVVPFCALLCVRPIAALWGSRTGRVLIVSLGLLALLTHLPAVYFLGCRWNVTADFPDSAWSWSHPPFLEWHFDR